MQCCDLLVNVIRISRARRGRTAERTFTRSMTRKDEHRTFAHGEERRRSNQTEEKQAETDQRRAENRAEKEMKISIGGRGNARCKSSQSRSTILDVATETLVTNA